MSDRDQLLAESAHMFHSNYDYFCKYSPLVIQTKDSGMSPLIPNPAQRMFREEVKRQEREQGHVRLVILKARQLGLSTDIAGYLFHKTSMNSNVKTEVMAHLSDAANELFGKFDTFYENLNPLLKASKPLGINSAKEKEFKTLKSIYKVSTAGSTDVGRSLTRQNLHLSELAFYPDAEKIFDGMLNSVATRGRNTSVIIESTANGISGKGKFFYDLVQAARHGRSEFKLLFIPWFVMPEYQIPIDDKFKGLTQEEQAYKDIYKVTDEQIYFRRVKINEKPTFERGLAKFRQEYPSNIDEAFQTSVSSLIDFDAIKKCMGSTDNDHMGLGEPMILGVDPAARNDRAVIQPRQGRKFYPPLVIDTSITPIEPMEFVSEIVKQIIYYKPDKVFLDRGENGDAIYSRLKELGYGHLVTAVMFNHRAIQNDLYMNIRAEMWIKLRDMIHEGCSLPDDSAIAGDLACMPDYKLRDGTKIYLKPKDEIKKDNDGMSPDIGDAMALTFAYPVVSEQVRGMRKVKRRSS